MPGRDALAAIIEQVGDSYLQRRLLRQAERATPGFLAGFEKSVHDINCVLGDLGEEDLVELVRRGGAPTVRDLAAVVAEYPTLSRRVAAAVPDGRWKVLEADPKVRPEPARARATATSWTPSRSSRPTRCPARPRRWTSMAPTAGTCSWSSRSASRKPARRRPVPTRIWPWPCASSTTCDPTQGGCASDSTAWPAGPAWRTCPRRLRPGSWMGLALHKCP